jgi:hypothetical protein
MLDRTIGEIFNELKYDIYSNNIMPFIQYRHYIRIISGKYILVICTHFTFTINLTLNMTMSELNAHIDAQIEFYNTGKILDTYISINSKILITESTFEKIMVYSKYIELESISDKQKEIALTKINIPIIAPLIKNDTVGINWLAYCMC